MSFRPTPPTPPTPRTAFVLAGGASLGALQVGMLHALYERGITPDLLVGTSVGALNAAYVASRPQTEQTARELARVWHTIHRSDLFPIHAPTLIGGLGRRRDHIVPDRPLKQLVSRHLGIERLEEAAVPVHLITFDLNSGQEVCLSDGPAVEAVAATAAVPGVYPPVAWGERLLVDGGVVNNTPISHAVELGAERIYVLPTGDPSDRALPFAPQGAIDAAIHAFTLLVGSRLEADLARYAKAAELIVLPAANPTRVQPTDFDHSARLIASGLTAARAALSSSKLPRAIAA
jgi:NTE family protein